MLFLCRENSARSIMAEALLRELGDHRYETFSAGAEPATCVHPFTMAQLRPGVSALDRLNPKSWLEFTGEWAPRMDIVIAMCDQVAEYHAPVFPGQPEFYQWHFADPLAEGMTDAERTRSFEKVFWEILRRINLFISVADHAETAASKTMTIVELSC